MLAYYHYIVCITESLHKFSSRCIYFYALLNFTRAYVTNASPLAKLISRAARCSQPVVYI